MCWQVDNEKNERFGSKVDEVLQKAMQALQLLLPGTAVVYYGDEIGMKNGGVSAGNNTDPLTKLQLVCITNWNIQSEQNSFLHVGVVNKF